MRKGGKEEKVDKQGKEKKMEGVNLSYRIPLRLRLWGIRFRLVSDYATVDSA